MARKSAPREAYRQSTLSNQALIESLMTTHNIVGEDSNSEILEHLLRQESNLDCIIDDDERCEVAEKFGWSLPTDADRVDTVLAQIKASTNAKGRANWASCIDGDVLVDAEKYHKVRNQRLKEQIRQVKKKVETSWDLAESKASATEASGGAEPVRWEDAKDAPLERLHTWHPKFDRWFGKTVDYIKRPGKADAIVETCGVAKGFSYAIAAPQGMGKTRLMVKIMGKLCGPTKRREDGVMYGGNTGMYFQAEETMGMFVSTFLRNVWNRDLVNVTFSPASMLSEVEHYIRRDRPDFVVIDSRDMIHEFTGPDTRVKDGVMRFNELLAQTGTTAFIVCHVAKSTGDMKGSSMFGHMVRAVILGALDDHADGRFTLTFSKNRAGETRKAIRWKHEEHTVDLDEGSVIESVDKPDMTRLSDTNSDMSLNDSILASIEAAQSSGNEIRKAVSET